MASSWISNVIASGVQSAIQPAVASAGGYVGGAVSYVGTGVNGIGESVNSYVRRYGSGIEDYGNAIRDWASADGPRTQTAANPLGLSATTAGGRHGIRNPQLGPAFSTARKSYSSSTGSSTRALPQASGSGKKGLSVPAARTADTSMSSKPKMQAKSTTSKSVASRSAVGSKKLQPSNTESEPPTIGKVKISAESKPRNVNKKAASKASPASAGVKTVAKKPTLAKNSC